MGAEHEVRKALNFSDSNSAARDVCASTDMSRRKRNYDYSVVREALCYHGSWYSIPITIFELLYGGEKTNKIHRKFTLGGRAKLQSLTKRATTSKLDDTQERATGSCDT